MVSRRDGFRPDSRGGLAGAILGAIIGFLKGLVFSAAMVLKMDWSMLWIYQFTLPFVFNGFCFGLFIAETLAYRKYVRSRLSG